MPDTCRWHALPHQAKLLLGFFENQLDMEANILFLKYLAFVLARPTSTTATLPGATLEDKLADFNLPPVDLLEELKVQQQLAEEAEGKEPDQKPPGDEKPSVRQYLIVMRHGERIDEVC